MAEIRLKLAPQCRMMNICGVDIIGNPETSTIIGLNKDGVALVQKMQLCEPIDTSTLNENQLELIKNLSTEGFFTANDSISRLMETYLHVTSHCNLMCPGCYSYESNRNLARNLTLDELKRIIDNLVRAGLTHLVISGGEPFTRDDLVDLLIYARSQRQIQYIECITNGTAPLDKYRDATRYLDKLTFSLDSAKADDAIIRPAKVFNEVEKKLALLHSEGRPVSIVFTIHHANVAHCSDLVIYANSLDIEFRFSLLTIETFNGENAKLALTSADNQVFHDFIMCHQDNVPVEDSSVSNSLGCILSCGAGGTMISVDSDGCIYPCHMFVHRKQFVMGNALYDDIKGIINNPINNPFHEIDVDCIEHCRDCTVRYICGGGCRFRAYAVNGSIYGSDPMCKTYIDNKLIIIEKLLHLSS